MRRAGNGQCNDPRHMWLVVNDEKIRVRHPASQQAGNVGSVLVQLVEQGADVGLGIDEDGEESLGSENADDGQPGSVLNDTGCEVPTCPSVAELRARVDEGGYQGRKTVSIHSILGSRGDRQPIPAEYDDGVYTFTLRQRINNVANR